VGNKWETFGERAVDMSGWLKERKRANEKNLEFHRDAGLQALPGHRQ
jgi:hypothetical protein